MAATDVVPGLFRIPLAFVDAYAPVGSDSVDSTGMRNGSEKRGRRVPRRPVHLLWTLRRASRSTSAR